MSLLYVRNRRGENMVNKGRHRQGKLGDGRAVGA